MCGCVRTLVYVWCRGDAMQGPRLTDLEQDTRAAQRKVDKLTEQVSVVNHSRTGCWQMNMSTVVLEA